MNTITIETKETSNPKIIKFEASVFLTDHQSYEFNNIDEAIKSPLAQQLFYLPFVKKVYISANFIAVERYDIVSWDEVKDEVAEQIENYINSGSPVVHEEKDKRKIPITIYAESTPNPTVMKFVANKKLVTKPYEFTSIDDTASSELAKQLFHFPFVKSVFFDENFVSITKYEMADWNDITLELREFLKTQLENGLSIIDNAQLTQDNNKTENSLDSDTTEHTGISKEIVDILDEYVKPAVASDGGNIVFKSYDEDSKTVSVILQGACSGCPSSTITLKNGIETMLKEMIGQKIERVVAING